MPNSKLADPDPRSLGYRFRLKPLSAWASPWHADTLWGSLCWIWRDVTNEKSFTDVIERTRSGDPPFIVSDGCPADVLPYPVGASPGGDKDRKSKPAWCKSADLRDWDGGETPLPAACLNEAPFKAVTLLHAQRNRFTDSTESGALFETDQFTFNPAGLAPEERFLSVYVRSEPEALQTLTHCLRLLSMKGFGARASTGFGSFEVIAGPERCPWLDISQDDREFISLSHFVPAKDDPSDGCWRLHLKHPKFAANLVPRLFKGNVLMLTPGSRFRVTGALKPFYGRAIHMNREEGFQNAFHYGFAFVAPLATKKAAVSGDATL